HPHLHSFPTRRSSDLPKSAYQSINHITNDVTLGWLVRGMHKWGASVFIILMFFHMARVFLFGAYKYPRELNWIIGVMLLAVGMRSEEHTSELQSLRHL